MTSKRFQEMRNRAKRSPKPHGICFAEALLGEAPWLNFTKDYKPLSSGKSIEPLKITPIRVKEDVSNGSLSEKKEVLNSLKEFAKTTLGDKTKKKIYIPGGEVKLEKTSEDGVDFYNHIEIEGKQIENSLPTARVCFVGNFEKDLESKDKTEDKAQSLELLERMISAMGLESGDYLVIDRIQFDHQGLDKLVQKIINVKPEFIIAFGGKTANFFLGKQERLQKTHGQFFNIKFSSKTSSNDSTVSQVVPIFHPDYLLINLDMKRTAWNDLQKVMKAL